MAGLTNEAADWFSARVRALPPAVAHIAAPYLRSSPVGRRRRSGFDPPYWLLLPRWLYAAASRKRRQTLGAAFLGDICWGQYGLYLCVRMHDDLLDGQATDTRLVFAGDYILVEAQRAFAPYVCPAFWPMFSNAVATSVRSILEAHEQGTPGSDWTATDLDVHARIAHVFRMGSAAVCLATDQERAMPAVFALGDALSVMSQMLDDLHDLEEDLARGYVSPGARFLLRSSRGLIESASMLQALAEAIVIGDGSARFMAEMRRRLDDAWAAAGELALPEAMEYVRATSDHLAQVETGLHASRVAAFFVPMSKR